MRVRVGHWVVVEAPDDRSVRREGEIVALTHDDGTPPYWVRWTDDDHRSLVFPGPDAHVEEEPPRLARAHRSAHTSDRTSA